MKTLIVLMVFLLLFTWSSLAVEINIPKSDYSHGEIVAISVNNCVGISLLQITAVEVVAMEQGRNNWQTSYNTNSDSAVGKYTLQVSCDDGTTAMNGFCLDLPNCNVSSTGVGSSTTSTIYDSSASGRYLYFQNSYKDDLTNYSNFKESYVFYKRAYFEALNVGENESWIHLLEQNMTSAKGKIEEVKDKLRDLKRDLRDFVDSYERNETRNEDLWRDLNNLKTNVNNLFEEVNNYFNKESDVQVQTHVRAVSETAGTTCLSEWSCSQWSYCPKELIQSRTCQDFKKCSTSRTETKVCFKCEESWRCQEWSTCISGKQVRSCQDLHACGTMTDKPIVEKFCSVPVVETVHLDVKAAPPKEISKPLPKPVEVQKPSPSFFKSYLNPLLITGVTFLILVISLLVYLLIFKPKSAQNKELQDYILKEKAKNISNERIKSALLKAGWNEKNVNNVLGG